MHPSVRVVTSGESAARDAATIAAGTPARALMHRAGAAAAGEIALRHPELLRRGVIILAGPGNNGGDGWVVARALAAAGASTRVVSPVGSHSPDCVAERALASRLIGDDEWRDADQLYRGEGIVVDALLGTGATGAPRGPIAAAIALTATARTHGAIVVSLDIPSGVDPTTGAVDGAVAADLTITFGAIKRGQLIARGHGGCIVVVDIGLSDGVDEDAALPQLVDERWVARSVPHIAAESHKGIRKKLAIIGGDRGMAGAAILAARAALRSGIGMVRVVTHPDSVAAVQCAEPSALAAPWPESDADLDRDILRWADALVIGPGLGKSARADQLIHRVLAAWDKPVLLDADALNAFDGKLDALRALAAGKALLLTPHPAECARLAETTVDDVLARRFEIGGELAARVSGSLCAVLLKGVPTVISDANGSRLVSAAGNPALATAGAGDVLSGIAGTLLAQLSDPLAAGAAAAWIHGHAAEVAAASTRHGQRIRGTTLDDVVQALRDAWPSDFMPTRYPMLAELPAVAQVRAP